MPRNEVTTSRHVIMSKRQRRNLVILAERSAVARPWGVSYYSDNQDPIALAELTSKGRKKLKTSSFAIPEKRKYPINDESHARNALARVSQHGTPEEKRRVRAAVKRKFPGIGQKNKSKRGGY